MDRREREQAAALLRDILNAVNRGNLSADGPAAVALERRLEGALLALEAMDRPGD
jgi:hypothetical protein